MSSYDGQIIESRASKGQLRGTGNRNRATRRAIEEQKRQRRNRSA